MNLRKLSGPSAAFGVLHVPVADIGKGAIRVLLVQPLLVEGKHGLPVGFILGIHGGRMRRGEASASKIEVTSGHLAVRPLSASLLLTRTAMNRPGADLVDSQELSRQPRGVAKPTSTYET